MLRALSLALWGSVLLQSAISGRLDLLLRAVFHPLVWISGGVLLLLAAVELRAAASRAPRRSSPGPRVLLLSCAIAVLVLAQPPRPSFADLASNRDSNLLEEPALSFVSPPAQRSLTDWVRLLRSEPDPSLHAGGAVRISGFVLPDGRGSAPAGPPDRALLPGGCQPDRPAGALAGGGAGAAGRSLAGRRGGDGYRNLEGPAPQPGDRANRAADPQTAAPPGTMTRVDSRQGGVLEKAGTSADGGPGARPGAAASAGESSPRLLALEQAAASSGPAALSLRFSRPMDRLSVEKGTALNPDLRFTVQGEHNPLLLLPEAGQRITGPVAVRLAGRDRRGLALRERLWHWDPRPLLVAVVPVPGGEQLQLRQPDGRWSPLSPVWAEIPELVPLGDGSGRGAGQPEWVRGPSGVAAEPGSGSPGPQRPGSG